MYYINYIYPKLFWLAALEYYQGRISEYVVRLLRYAKLFPMDIDYYSSKNNILSLSLVFLISALFLKTISKSRARLSTLHDDVRCLNLCFSAKSNRRSLKSSTPRNWKCNNNDKWQTKRIDPFASQRQQETR